MNFQNLIFKSYCETIKYSLPCSICFQVWLSQLTEISHHKPLVVYSRLAPHQMCKYKQSPVKYTKKKKN